MDTPHYVRFARSLALLGGLGATAVGCYGTSGAPDAAASIDADNWNEAAVPTQDAYSADDAPLARVDAYSAVDAPIAASDAPATDDANLCATCVCVGGFYPEDAAGADAGGPDCYTIPGAEICCAAIGPLFPPDLAV